MTPERWRKLRAALEAAAAVPPEQVDAVLSSVCGDDPSLIAEARSMLRDADSARGFLESPASLGTDRLVTRPDHPQPPRSGGPLVGPRSLSPDLQGEAAWRLKIVALVLGSIVVGALALQNALRWADLTAIPHLWLYNAVGLLIVAVSALVAWLAHGSRINAGWLVNVGLGYEVLVAFGIALQDNLGPHSVGRPLEEISWMCVWIVMFPLVVPASPRRVLAASVLAAFTWLAAFVIGVRLGTPVPPTRVIVLNFLEGYLAAGLALLPTLILRRLHAQVEKARHMGSYQLVEILGHGGMGEVWRAQHDMLARPAAIKLIRPQGLGVGPGSSAAALLARFEREAQATAALHSPHTVELYDFGVTPNGTFYYVMELLDGLDLEQLVGRFGPVPAERAVHFLLQMCDSLEDAHHAGLVHRDVKPANVYVCRSGVKRDVVKLLDFGLVKPTWTAEGQDQALTGRGAITGTPAYLAPELALGNQPIDGRADLYALGCVAYWLLTGLRVFEADSPLQVMMQHIQTMPIAPSRRAGLFVPRDLEELILWCLQKQPDRRPASAAEVARHLASCRLDARWTQERARAWWDEHLGPASR